jgi:hypothetical protein
MKIFIGVVLGLVRCRLFIAVFPEGKKLSNFIFLYLLYSALIGFVQTGVWGGTPQKPLSPDEPPKAARKGSGA